MKVNRKKKIEIRGEGTVQWKQMGEILKDLKAEMWSLFYKST